MTEIALSPDETRIVLSILERIAPECDTWVFGSRTRPSPKLHADLDLAISGNAPLSLSVLARLAEEFSESPLPFKVDIVDWSTVGEEFRKLVDPDRRILRQASR